MKGKLKFEKPIVVSAVCLSMILSVGSCAGDGFDEETFSGGVTNTQLESPDASKVSFEKLAGKPSVKVEWPVIMGAGGYLFSMYIVDDPTNPVAVVKDSIIDGCSVACTYLDDTNYKVEIKTLGNDKYNNKDAASVSEVTWSTLVPATTIPAGTDLNTYFENNPITSGKDVEVAYELEAGGSYTISGDLNLGVNNVQLRGNKVNHAKVTFTGSGAIVSSGGGMALKFIDFDCDVVSKGSFVKFGDVPEEIKGMNSYGIVTNPMIIQSCEIRNVRHYLVNINGKKYAIQNFIVRDCLIKFYQDAEIFNFNSNNSFVRDFELSSSTLYNLSEASNGRFMRVAGGKGADVGWADCSMNFTSNTFYNISCDQEAFNSNVWNRQKNTVNLSKNIFYDSCKGEFNRRIVGGRTDNAKTCDNNCYWYKGGSGLEKEANGNYGDKSTSAYGVDPGFKDPANGDFTVRHSEVISHGSGDPRWLK